MKTTLLNTTAAFAIAMALSGPAFALDQVTFKERVESITANYEPQLEELERQAGALNESMPSDEEIVLNIDIDEWSEIRFSMHVPEITMDRWEYSMHIPEVTTKHRHFSWHVPEITMKMRDFGFMKTKIPEVTMRRHEWSTKIPEVTMRHRKFSMDIPKVTMKQRDFSFHVPQVSVGGPRDDIETMKSDGQAIQAKAQQLAHQMQVEIGHETRSYLTASRAEAEQQFQFALKTLQAGIANAPNGNIRAELDAQHKAILGQRSQVLNEIDAQIKALA